MLAEFEDAIVFNGCTAGDILYLSAVLYARDKGDDVDIQTRMFAPRFALYAPKNAFLGVQTIGSPRKLKLVLTSTGQLVFSLKRVSSRWNSGLVLACTV